MEILYLCVVISDDEDDDDTMVVNGKWDSELARLSTYGAQEISKWYMRDEKLFQIRVSTCRRSKHAHLQSLAEPEHILPG